MNPPTLAHYIVIPIVFIMVLIGAAITYHDWRETRRNAGKLGPSSSPR